MRRTPPNRRDAVASDESLASIVEPLIHFFDNRIKVEADDPGEREAILRAAHDLLRRGLVLTAVQEKAVESIGTVLGPHLPAMDSAELAEFLFAEVENGFKDALARFGTGRATADETMLQLRSILLPEAYVARVSVPLLMVVEPILDSDLGGPDRLRIEAGSDETRSLVGEFGGVLTRGMALGRACQRVEEVLGASYATGLIELRRLTPQMPVGGFVEFDECSRDGAEWRPHYASEGAKDMAGWVTRAGEVNPVREETARLILSVAVNRKCELTDIEKELRRSGKGSPERDRRLHPLRALFGSAAPRAQELANCARLLGRAAVEAEDGRAIGEAFICLEATLLEKNPSGELTQRLMEAIAYRVGRSAEERSALRKEVKRLYAIRSDFTHKGHVGVDVAFSGARRRVLEIAAVALRREIEELPFGADVEPPPDRDK